MSYLSDWYFCTSNGTAIIKVIKYSACYVVHTKTYKAPSLFSTCNPESPKSSITWRHWLGYWCPKHCFCTVTLFLSFSQTWIAKCAMMGSRAHCRKWKWGMNTYNIYGHWGQKQRTEDHYMPSLSFLTCSMFLWNIYFPPFYSVFIVFLTCPVYPWCMTSFPKHFTFPRLYITAHRAVGLDINLKGVYQVFPCFMLKIWHCVRHRAKLK